MDALARWDSAWRPGSALSLFLTIGAIIGPLPLAGRLGFTVGAGYQFAVAPTQRLTPALTPEYGHAFILTTRLLF